MLKDLRIKGVNCFKINTYKTTVLKRNQNKGED